MNAEDYMRQAAHTAEYYMMRGREHIIAVYGETYLNANPQLLGDYMKTAAMDFHTCFTESKRDEYLPSWPDDGTS